MNASLSDGNEPVIDIFILSANSPLSTQLEKQLRDEGYYVTLFSDGTHLLETLRNGKPNLLICDTTSADADAFEVCRQIKADDYLWNIPVLILTGAADLGDLLHVLDCNADNFIAHPFDPPYLLSLIEGMLTVPVERQTPEQIKTQFKIKHNEQVYVVTADRRKLLEFLLSSFEIAVNKSSDLSRAQEDIRNLGFTIRKLEENVHENTKVISIINETLKIKEQKLTELTGQISDREQTLREKIAAIDQLSRDLSTEQSAHAEMQREIQLVEKEKEDMLAAHRSAIDDLQQQVSGMSSELAMLRPALEHANGELGAESTRRQEAEKELSLTATQKEQVEKALLSVSTEYEQLKINFGAEKNRAQEAEQELNAVLLAKTQSEQDLTGIINDLKATAKEQAAALSRLKDESESERARFTKELESEHSKIQYAEENLHTVMAAKEQSEASHRTAIEAGLEELRRLQTRLDAAGSLLEEKELGINTLNDELAAVRTARESAETELASVSHTLAETNTTLEAETQALASAKEDLARVFAEKEKAEALAESLSESLREFRDQLEQEKFRFRDAEERMSAMILQRDRELGELRGVHEDARTSLSSQNTVLEQMKRDLEAAVSARMDLEGKLQSAEEKIHRIGQELETASEARAEGKQQLSSVAGELERVKTILEQETSRRQEVEARLMDMQSRVQQLGLSASELERVKTILEQETSRRQEAEARLMDMQSRVQQLGLSASELDRVKASLEQETSRRQEAEDQLRDAQSQQQQLEQDLERFVSETKTLHADLITERRMHEAAKLQNRSLEEQVSALIQEKSTLSQEKLRAEQAAADLTAEIDQARVALADEWEDHMTDHDRLAEVVGKKPQAGPAPLTGMRREAEIIKKRSLIVKVPNIPADTSPLPRSMVAIDPVKASEPESSHIRSVEDLFEDDEDDKETPAGAPVVSIIEEPATEPVRDVLPDSILNRSDFKDSLFEEESTTPGTGSTIGEDSADDEDSLPENNETVPVSGQNVAFNRTQWLDLLKWSHHCDALEPDQRMQIVRMGRLIQKGRKLTKKQEEQVLEMIALVQSLGYRIS